MNIVGHCLVCRVPMIASWSWERMSPKPAGVKPHYGHGYCSAHYMRAKRNGSPTASKPRAPRGPQRPEDVPERHCAGCGRPAVGKTHAARWPGAFPGRLLLAGRGLCETCHDKVREDHSPLCRSAEEVLDEWVFLRDDGCSDVRLAAARMGMTFAALDKALWRARKRGDERGSLVPFAHDRRRAA